MTKALMISGCLLLLTILVAGNPEYRAECAVWQNVSDTQMYNNTVPMNCHVNIQCTGIDCTGEFSYRGMYTMNQQFVEDFCFGVAIHPCDKPLSSSIYVGNPEKSNTYQQKLTSGTRSQLPAFHYDLSHLVTADGFVDIRMQPRDYQGNSYVRIGVDYKTRVTGPFGLETWPGDLAFHLMRDTLIPVPPCIQSVVSPTHIPGSCVKYTPPASTTRKPGSPTQNPTPGPNCTIGDANSCPIYETCKKMSNSSSKVGNCVCTPGYYRIDGMCMLHPGMEPKMPVKTCIPNTLRGGGCGQHQLCVQKGKSGTCQCMSAYQWNGSDCVTKAPTPSTLIIGEPDYSKDNAGSGSSTSKIIIPVAVGAVVLIMAIAAAVVVVKYRRYKARYGQHTLLMAEEDDRDDGDAPMVEA